jgi:group I intron endonuclease
MRYNQAKELAIPKRPGIYKILCTVNCKIYIGSAKNLFTRHRLHISHLKSGVHKNRHLQSAFKLYGEEAFEFYIIEYVDSLDMLLVREQHWLDFTKCYEKHIGFNICKIAGSSLGVKRTDEFKAKIREANINRSDEVKQRSINAVKSAITGKPSWNMGIKMWDGKQPPRGTLGKKFPNRKFTPEGYARICESNRKPRSKEYSQKRSVISSKIYYFSSPDSELDLKIENLSEFCDKIGLNKTRMYQVAKGHERHHRGWTISEFFI